MGSGQVPTNSAANIPDSGSVQIIQHSLPTDKQGTLQPPPPTTSVAVSPATTLTPTSPQEGTGPHDSEAPPGPALRLQSGAPPRSIASGSSHQTPAGRNHPWVTSRSVKRRPHQTSKDAGSSGDDDGDDYLSSKKLRSELSPATTLPVKNENANTEKKSMTDHPPCMHEWEQVSSPHSVQSCSSSVPSPHPSEDRNSDTEQYGTPPPSPGLQLSLSPSSTSFSSQHEEENTGFTTDGTDVKSKNVTSSKAKSEADRSEKDSSKEVNLSTGPKPAASSKVAGDQGQRQDSNQSVYHLPSQSNKQVEDNNNSSTPSITSKSSTKEKGNGKPPFSASNSLSDTSLPKDDTGAQGGAGAGPDNQQTSSTKNQKVGVLIVFYYVPI